MNLSNNKILITGGGSGIGLALAERVAADNTVIICGRRATTLKEAAAKIPEIITRQCDLSSSEQREALFQWISSEHGDLNVLVNNAGMQNWMSPGDDNFFQKAKEEIAINIEAQVHLISLFLNHAPLTTIMN